MSDPNNEARGKIARAIVYAARQAYMINNYGMTWEAIETNTANILAGCSVPADGKMNSAEAVQATIMERLRTQADTPPNRNVFASHPLPWKVRRVTIPSWRGPGQPRATRHELIDDNGRIVGNIRNEWVAQKMVELVNGTKDEHAQGIISRQIASLQRIKGERDEARAERDKALEAYAALRESMRPHPDHARLAELEARNVELRQMLEQSQQDREMDVIRLTRDRDGFRNGAQFWMDSAKAACARVVKLRTVLEDIHATVHPSKWMSVKTALDETK